MHRRRLSRLERAAIKRRDAARARAALSRFVALLADWPAEWVRRDAWTGAECDAATIERVRQRCRAVWADALAGKLAELLDICRAMPPEARAGLRWWVRQRNERGA